MKLEIELVPSSAWFQNFRNQYPDKWKAAKQACYRAAGYRCEICGGKGKKWPVEVLTNLARFGTLCHPRRSYEC